MRFLLFSILFYHSLIEANVHIQCHDHANLKYEKKMKTGGMRPFPGMKMGEEMITNKNEVIYKKSFYAACENNLPCEQDSPSDDQTDLIFSFDQLTKAILETENSPQSPMYLENYIIQLNIFNQKVWMICSMEKILAP